MKKSLLTLSALLALGTFAAAPELLVSGVKKDVVKKDGVYVVTPSTRTRVQLYPKNRIAVYANAEVEVIAEVSGAGNIQLGVHFYDNRSAWKGGTASQMIRVDAAEAETFKRTLKIEKTGIISVCPYINCYSGPVKVESLTIRLKGGLDASTIADAPKMANWNYVSYSKAIKCQATADGGLSIITGRGQITELAQKQLAAKDGDKFQFAGEFSGKGTVNIGLHLYDKSRTWQGAVWAQVKINGKSGKLPLLTVKTPAGKKAAAFVAPVFRITQNSEITCKNITVTK